MGARHSDPQAAVVSNDPEDEMEVPVGPYWDAREKGSLTQEPAQGRDDSRKAALLVGEHAEHTEGEPSDG